MNEGKELLEKIIKNRKSTLSNLNTDDIYVDNVNLVDLNEQLNNIDNFCLVTDSVINKLVKSEDLKKDVKKLRDMFVGKRDYKLNINLTDKYLKIIEKFKKCLDEYLSTINSDVINKESILNTLDDLENKIKNNQIINDIDSIEKIVKNYDELNFDKSMLSIVQFIDFHNINIIKHGNINPPIFNLNVKRRQKLDAKKKEILDYINVKEEDVPKYLLFDLKKHPLEIMEKNFKVIKKNKAEDGGILHFVGKEDILTKLYILMYSSEESILNIINAIKENDNLDINLLKQIIKYIPSVFISIDNNYILPKYEDFIKNITYLKDNNINFKTLINRSPIFMIMSNDVLLFTLNYLEKNGANGRNIVNRCYKTLATKPSLLIENIKVMKDHHINLEKFFSKENINYNLLKMSNLDKKLSYLESRYNLLRNNEVDYVSLNKIIVSKVYNESKYGAIGWGD